MIGENNQKPLLLSYKGSINWYSPLGNKPVITQLHSYAIFVINTRVITKISYSYWVITITNLTYFGENIITMAKPYLDEFNPKEYLDLYYPSPNGNPNEKGQAEFYGEQLYNFYTKYSSK